MRKYLLPGTGNFYKANLHCHTILSDGKCTPEEVKQIYKDLGYSVVAYTDHDIFIPHNNLTDGEFLALNGFEMETNEPKKWEEGPKTCHLCYIALEKDQEIQPMWHRTGYRFRNAVENAKFVKFDESEPDYVRRYSSEGISEMMKIGRDKGFFVTYNHPTWSLEQYPEYIGYTGMNAMEMFNGSCLVGGFEDYNPRVYDDIVKSGKRISCVAGDDNHNSSPGTRKWDSGVAFTMIKAENLEYRTITKALENGDCYASMGPEIYELWYEDGKVHIKCSDADMISFNYDKRKANAFYAKGGEEFINEATVTIPENVTYFRITVTDKFGKKACTKAYFVDEINK